MKVSILTLALGAALGSLGCVSFSGEFGSRIPVENLSRIQDGKTTRDQIVAWFGPPSAFYNTTFLDVILEEEENIEARAPIMNDIYTYRFIENDTTVFFVPIFFAKVAAGAEAETLTVFFDDQGLVKYHAFRRDAASGD